jgi:hypothetical protein
MTDCSMDPTIERVIRCGDDLVEVFRARKAQLRLSNAEIEAQLLLAGGIIDKYLGPSRTKQLLPQLVDDLMTYFGIEFVVRINPELEAKMQARYERRDEAQVRPHRRLSKELLAIARSQLFAELGKRGGVKRAASLTAKQRSGIARSGAMARHRVAASASEGAQA